MMTSATGSGASDAPSASTMLLVAEATGLQDRIVGNATELRIIRGGSLLLADAFADAERLITSELGPAADINADATVSGWQLVARTSGRLLAIVPGDVAERLAARIRALLGERLPGLSISVGLGSFDHPPRDGETSFDVARRTARERVLTTATRRPATYHLGTATCDASGVETASQMTTAEGWSLSETSDRRQRADLSDPDIEGVMVERRMDRIGRATLSARFGGYVAVVCADGNAVGARFRDLHTAAEVARESESIARGVDEAEQAAYRAALDLHHQLGGALPLPVNPLMRAGDDLRYVLPGHVALSFAQQLVSASSNLQACAGVFFCHASLPFTQSHDAAERLLGTAKRASRAGGDGTTAHVAFALQSGSGVGDLTVSDRSSASPYRADHLTALLTAARTLDSSTSQLRAVRDALLRGGRIAEREWALHWLNATRDQRDALTRLWAALGCRDSVAEQPFPASRDRHGWLQVSPIGDLMLLRQLMSSAQPTEATA